MGFEQILVIALIAAFFAVTIFSLGTIVIIRLREQDKEQLRKGEEILERFDTALDTALVELNKTGRLVQQEISDKYQAMLFLYNLLEEKQKEIEKNSGNAAIGFGSTNTAGGAGSANSGFGAVDTGLNGQVQGDNSNTVPETTSNTHTNPQRGAMVNAPAYSVGFGDILSEEKSKAQTAETNAQNEKSATVGTVSTPSAPRQKPAVFANPQHEIIWELRELGLGIPDIAKELDMGQGEVKLILDLADRSPS